MDLPPAVFGMEAYGEPGPAANSQGILKPKASEDPQASMILKQSPRVLHSELTGVPDSEWQVPKSEGFRTEAFDSLGEA